VIDHEEEARAFAYYASRDGQPAGAVLCDRAMTNFAGAALTMLPPGPIRESNAQGEVSERVFDNTAEVLNVLAQVFYEPHGSPVSLEHVFDTQKTAPAEAIVASVGDGARRIAMRVDIDGYGAGTLAVRWA
jgi:hypothetical protein